MFQTCQTNDPLVIAAELRGQIIHILNSGESEMMEQQSQNHVVELVIYQIKPENKADFPALLPQVRKAVRQMKGFVSYKNFRAAKAENTIMDLVVWESLEDAKNAAKQVREIEEFQPFMNIIENVVSFDHYSEIV